MIYVLARNGVRRPLAHVQQAIDVPCIIPMLLFDVAVGELCPLYWRMLGGSSSAAAPSNDGVVLIIVSHCLGAR
jgi:hypothetical protein